MVRLQNRGIKSVTVGVSGFDNSLLCFASAYGQPVGRETVGRTDDVCATGPGYHSERTGRTL
jgi:hypothetical protein